MRILTTVVYTTAATLLLACGQQDPASAIDPRTGVDCFETHRATLPPGTQYEGIDTLTEDQITIKIMNGVDVVTITCELNPDGSLKEKPD